MGTRPTRKEFEGVSGAEGLRLAGMDWPITERPLMAGEFTIPDKKALFRGDNGAYLATVGSGYEARSYSDSMLPTIDLLSKEGGAHVVNAGYFGIGQKGFIQMKPPGEDFAVPGTNGADRVERLLTIITAHDGSMPLCIVETAIRIVCANTFAAAFADKTGFRMTARHSANIDARIKTIQKALAHSREAYKRMEENIAILAGKKTTEESARAFLMALLPDAENAKNKSRTENIRAEILALADHGKGQDIDGVKGTLWALYNGVTEYVDHVRGTRGDSDEERASNRAESIMVGSGNDLKNDAMRLALEFAK